MEGTKLHFYMTGQDRERNVSRTDISAGHHHQPSPLRSAKLPRIDHLKLLLFGLLFGNFLSQAEIYLLILLIIKPNINYQAHNKGTMLYLII